MRCSLSIAVLLGVLVCACHPELPVTSPQLGTPSNSGAREGSDPGVLEDITYQGQSLRVTKKNGLFYLSDDVILPNNDISAEQAISPVNASTTAPLTGVYRKYRINT